MKSSLLVFGLLLVTAIPSPAAKLTQRCVVANENCFVLRGPAAGLTPEQRIDLVNDRLANILGYENLRSVYLRPNHGDVEIRVGHSLLVTVTSRDALDNGTNTGALARVWGRRLLVVLPQARP